MDNHDDRRCSASQRLRADLILFCLSILLEQRVRKNRIILSALDFHVGEKDEFKVLANSEAYSVKHLMTSDFAEKL